MPNKKKCDNTSTGVIVRGPDGEFATVMRKNYPAPGWGMIAGHCDGDDPEVAVKREAVEKASISILELRMPWVFHGRVIQQCARPGAISIFGPFLRLSGGLVHRELAAMLASSNG